MKRIGLVIMLTLVAAILLVALAQTTSTTTPAAQRVGLPPWERGDQYLYRVFFANVTRMNQQAEDAERLGMNSQYLRTYYQNSAQLEPWQTTLLNQTAAELAARLAQYDERAKALRKEWHIVVQTKRQRHEPVPPIPAQIRTLQAGSEALILQARDQLRRNLGDSEFTRLDAYVRQHAPWKRPASSDEGGAQTTGATPQVKATISDHTLYAGLFHSVVRFKADAEEERALGFTELADGLTTSVQRRAGLTEEQGRILDEVATEYSQAWAALKPRLDAARLPYRKLCLEMLARDGKITQTAELAAVQQPIRAIASEVDALTDHAIQRLRQGLGDEEFLRLDGFVKRKANAPKTAVPGTSIQEVVQ